jgi:hypothetical protein
MPIEMAGRRRRPVAGGIGRPVLRGRSNGSTQDAAARLCRGDCACRSADQRSRVACTPVDRCRSQTFMASLEYSDLTPKTADSGDPVGPCRHLSTEKLLHWCFQSNVEDVMMSSSSPVWLPIGRQTTSIPSGLFSRSADLTARQAYLDLTVPAGPMWQQAFRDMAFSALQALNVDSLGAEHITTQE